MMAGIITQQDINNYKDQINKNGVGGAISVYQSLQNKGYTYAGWAGGVASGKTVTGQAALNFMAASSGKTFSESQLNNIRIDMANSYLNSLEKKLMMGVGKLQKMFHSKICVTFMKVFLRIMASISIIGLWSIR
ncbi:hypothetical protein [Neisseria sp. 83E34]|uniref:hypothetical protein n=1 Tax=Neisseria sp. 83E34 TaxID=1692264 RepID=UPI0006CE7446|nr:hypothetical protein [Neisseria sp. 83E34]KPN71877.1 hypothetical protein AKG09_04005 [Neisseria sp. 83E34]